LFKQPCLNGLFTYIQVLLTGQEDPVMMLAETDYKPPLGAPFDQIANRLANEGIPVNVIARGLEQAAADVRLSLEEALAAGCITEMPAADWPPTARRADHLPPHIAAARDHDLVISFMRTFKLTKLMASFILVLVKREEADKTTLHRVIEAQRAVRASRPDNPEETDPKMVDVVICNLRKKLKPFGLTIHTLWGHGYYLDQDGKRRALGLIERELHDRDAANDNTARGLQAA
jgi:hypothetical protein